MCGVSLVADLIMVFSLFCVTGMPLALLTLRFPLMPVMFLSHLQIPLPFLWLSQYHRRRVFRYSLWTILFLDHLCICCLMGRQRSAVMLSHFPSLGVDGEPPSPGVSAGPESDAHFSLPLLHHGFDSYPKVLLDCTCGFSLRIDYFLAHGSCTGGQPGQRRLLATTTWAGRYLRSTDQCCDLCGV